ncbi:MAG: hypothetical protein NTW86_11500 [Candidatus Sumerlaeota bacterium]|nr:hypothetical protein [Candidatus Sumerlaeota bacterium]
MPPALAFHGGEGSAEAAERGLRPDPLSDKRGFIGVYPRGESVPGRGFHHLFAGLRRGLIRRGSFGLPPAAHSH